jgi:ribose/xylose/arabinose/galactoside ABC-type transport system permease subunit
MPRNASSCGINVSEADYTTMPIALVAAFQLTARSHRGGPSYGFQRELDYLAAVHPLAFLDAEAEFGVGEMLA